ncbi:hypothetical protein D047_0181B, partial [Vibrio parahaemolyticus VPTS-2010_2]
QQDLKRFRLVIKRSLKKSFIQIVSIYSKALAVFK